MKNILDILKHKMIITGILLAVVMSIFIRFQTQGISQEKSTNTKPPISEATPPPHPGKEGSNPLLIDEESEYIITTDMLSSYVKIGAVKFPKKDPTSDSTDTGTYAPNIPKNGVSTPPTSSISKEDVKIIAQKYGDNRTINANWILALIEVSTNYLANFIQDDQNNSKDIGLMRINTETGKYYAEKLGIDYKGQETLFDPENNIAIGTACLKDIFSKNQDMNYIFTVYHEGEAATQTLYSKNGTYETVFSKQVIEAIKAMGGS